VQLESNWLTVGPPDPFDMADGMCAHKLVLSGEFIAFSCSKNFEDGSSRKIRVLSQSARPNGKPSLILEQSTPTDSHIMVSPNDSLVLIRSSPRETSVVYVVSSTVVTISIIADKSNLGWRTWINALNTCKVTKTSLQLWNIGNTLIVLQEGVFYRGGVCSYTQVKNPSTRLCQDVEFPEYGRDGMGQSCEESSTGVSAWSKQLKKIACDTSESNSGSAGLRLVQVDEYAIKITPLNQTCGLELALKLVNQNVDSNKVPGPIEPEKDVLPVLVDRDGKIVGVKAADGG